MQKLQESIFSIVKATNLSQAVFNYLQPTEEFSDKAPLGGILRDSRYGWLALGPKFCVVDLKTGLKIAAWTFGALTNNCQCNVTDVVELPTPLTENSQQLVISVESETLGGLICVFHINGSHILRCIQTEAIITNLTIFDSIPDGVFSCFDGIVIAGTRNGEIFTFDLNRQSLLQALKYTAKGCENLIHNETNCTGLTFLPLNSVSEIEEQREMALENGDHISVLLNENSFIEGQYIFRNPDGTVRMKAKRDHIRVSTLQYIPQLGSVAVGFNFGAFQIWNLITLELEFTSQVNVECLPVSHFGFQEPCDDPRAFCYLWVVYSAIDRFEEEEFPLAVMYSLTYHAKRMLRDSKYLYQEFLNSTIRFQVELNSIEGVTSPLIGGRCVACHTYSIPSTLGDEGEDSVLNICQLVWECWGEDLENPTHYGMLLLDLDQWYKDQMPGTQQIQNNAFMSAAKCGELPRDAAMLDVALVPRSLAQYAHAARLEEHFYPNSLQYNCVCLSTSEACIINTTGVQRHIISAIDETGPTALIRPTQLYRQCVEAGLTPLYVESYINEPTIEEQRYFLLSVALEARLSRFLKRCAHDWATGSHSGAGCTLTLLLDWCWKRAINLKQNARELTAPLFTSSSLPDRNLCRCLEHCVRQLTQLTNLLDSVLTKCCNLVIPDALSEIEEKYKGIGTVALYFQVVQWFLNVGLLPERQENLPYPCHTLHNFYRTRRLKLHRLHQNSTPDESVGNKSCPLLYIDQLIDNECGGETIHEIWRKSGSECEGLYPPPSLYSLLRLYLLPDIAEEHKHSLVLYLLVDYSMVYDELRYETVIRRLMQFPTMFGLSNTAIKATQAFWHLDHRDFDFALDQLQCLTGNTLSDWQHNVVLSALLAQKKSQAALHYLHVRKPAPIQSITIDKNENGMITSNNKVNDHDKLEDWQSCCNLYLARGLVYEALDVIRSCAQNVRSLDEKVQVLNFFFKGCRNTGQLSKILQIILLPFEEDVFIKYLQSCNDQQTSDILVMFYLQQTRYVEAQQYNSKLRQGRGTLHLEKGSSLESFLEIGLDRDTARDVLVDVACSSLPSITNKVVQCALNDQQQPYKESRVFAPRPMSVCVQAKSPKNTFTYKSSFIHDTIENASDTWLNRPKTQRGIKRALNIEETPFICTPKLTRTRSLLHSNLEMIEFEGQTPSKRPRLDLNATPRTPKNQTLKVNDKLTREIESFLEMPDTTPEWKIRDSRSVRESTPHSILKVKRSDRVDNRSSVDSRYLGESEDEMIETSSVHTHYSDSKHLRFTIPNGSESSTSSEPTDSVGVMGSESPLPVAAITELEDRPETPVNHNQKEQRSFESPPKKMSAGRSNYKGDVKARPSLFLSFNSSLSDDRDTSIETISDIPITLFNSTYHENPEIYNDNTMPENSMTTEDVSHDENPDASFEHPKVLTSDPPRGRRSIRRMETEESIPHLIKTRSHSVTPERQDPPRLRRGSTRSRSVTPERQDSPTLRRGSTRIRSVTPEIQDSPVLRRGSTRSRTVTPNRLDSPVIRQRPARSITPERVATSKTSPKLDAIPEQPQQETDITPQIEPTKLLRLTRSRSRSRTPERAMVQVEAKLEVIAESPKSEIPEDIESPSQSPIPYALRSRSRTPEVECASERVRESPRSLRSRSKTPERDSKLLSLKTHTIEKPSKTKKPLSRIVLEANTFSKAVTNKTEQKPDTPEVDVLQGKSVLHDPSDSIMECTPVKDSTEQTSNLLDISFSPIVNKSVLLSSAESSYKDKDHQSVNENNTKQAPTKALNFTAISETFYEKSVLKSYTSSAADNTDDDNKTNVENVEPKELVEEEIQCKVSITEEISSVTNKSVLKDVSSLITSDSDMDIQDENEEAAPEQILENVSNEEDATRFYEQQKHKIGEIEREIDEIKGTLSENETTSDSDDHQLENEREIDEIEGTLSENESTSVSDDHQLDDEEEHDVEEEHSITENSEDDDDAVISLDSSEDNQNDESNSSSQSDQLRIVESIDVEVIEEAQLAVATQERKISGNEYDENQGEPMKELQDEYQNNVISTLELENESNAADPLNQANYSLMTDDNSVIEAENSEIKLSLSQDDVNDKKIDVAYENEPTHFDEAVTGKGTSPTIQETEEVSSTTELEKETHEKEADAEIETMAIEHKETDAAVTTKEMESDIVTFVQDVVNVQTEEKEEIMETETEIKTTDKETNVTQITGNDKEVPIKSQEVAITTNIKEQRVEEKVETERVIEIEVFTEEIAIEETDVVDAVINVVPKPNTNVPVNTEIKEIEIAVDKPKSPARTRRRAQSTSSNKSIETAEMVEKNEKIPPSRKRTRSTSSQRSAGSKAESETKTTPESETTSEPQSIDTPTTTRRGRRTPSSATRVITRRMSKELSKLEELSDESVSTTPTKSVSMGKDDNLSVASDESKLSKDSAKSETSEVKLRRARRSLLANIKPDLTVIPENSEESSLGNAKEDAITEYSKDRRLTRKQKAVLEKLLTPRQSVPAAGRVRSRRSSAASNVSVISGSIEESPEIEAFDVEPIDRISLLEKMDFEGTPDKEEMEKPASPRSVFSDTSPKKRSRPSSSLSEGRIQTKTSQPPRRLSVEIAKLQSEVESPASSPGRARRASFHRAIEALHTPKGRRQSTDLKKSETGSTPASPLPSVDSDTSATPSRRSRRIASTQSNASTKSKKSDVE